MKLANSEEPCEKRLKVASHRSLSPEGEGTFIFSPYVALSSTGIILSNTDLFDLSTVGTCDIFVYEMRHRVM